MQKKKYSIEDLLEILRRLRGENGCPWDKVQTHDSIKNCMIEESYEAIDALEKGWARSWRARGWVKSDKKPALNPDLWAQLLELCEKHEMHYHWVKGHADNEYNNRCDALAVEQRDRYASGAK